MIVGFGIKWSEEEIDFLNKNYENNGPTYCSDKLGRTIRACQLKAKGLILKYKVLKDYYLENNLKATIERNYSYSSCLREIGISTRPGNYTTLKKYINLYNIDISHFYTDKKSGLLIHNFNNKMSISDILTKNSNYSSSHLKTRLYKEGFKEKICEMCEQTEEWMGKKMSLILDHINGINNDNRLENLRIVCPNCNSTLDTHCRGNKDNRSNKIKLHKCSCGNKMDKSAKICKKCSSMNQRKVERPTLEQLLLDIEESNYVKTGIKYGVSDNTIRKWIKQYKNV